VLGIGGNTGSVHGQHHVLQQRARSQLRHRPTHKALAFNRSAAYGLSGSISAPARSCRSVTAPTSSRRQHYSGQTTIINGKLQLGNGGTHGSITSDVVN